MTQAIYDDETIKSKECLYITLVVPFRVRIEMDPCGERRGCRWWMWRSASTSGWQENICASRAADVIKVRRLRKGNLPQGNMNIELRELHTWAFLVLCFCSSSTRLPTLEIDWVTAFSRTSWTVMVATSRSIVGTYQSYLCCRWIARDCSSLSFTEAGCAWEKYIIR